MCEATVAEFLEQKQFAVFGASEEPDCSGHRLVQLLAQAGYDTYPVNPRMARIDSMPCYGNLDELDLVPQVIAVALPPEATLEVLRCGLAHGVRRFWIQPGSESDAVRAFVAENGLSAVFHECLCERLGAGS